MAHGENARKNGSRGKEYWKSRLNRWGEQPGRDTKMRTHRHERQIGKRVTAEMVAEAEDDNLLAEVGPDTWPLINLIADPWDDLMFPYSPVY